MARSPQSSITNDLISKISDTITNHSRLSAAAAFQMGVLLGQVMHNTGALKGLRKSVAAAPSAIASTIPTFGLFDDKSARKTRRTSAAPKTRSSAKGRGAKRTKRANKT